MTKREAAIVSAYTGVLLGEFSDLHSYIEELFGHPVWTHELGTEATADAIKARSRADFLAIQVL